MTITGFSFSGVKIPAGDGGNGAGIRYQSGNLTLNEDYFHGNQDGLLATPFVTGAGNITINESEFGPNGTTNGQTHNLYVGMIGSLTITNSYFHDANTGHEIKSRAEVNTIENNRILDNNGTTSYSIDLPNGGQDIVSGNIIEKGLHSETNKMISFLEAPGTGTLMSAPTTGTGPTRRWSSVAIRSSTTRQRRRSSRCGTTTRLPVTPTVTGNTFWDIAPATQSQARRPNPRAHG